MAEQTAYALDWVSASPDVTLELGAIDAHVEDQDVAVDNLMGIVLPASLGSLPQASDVGGYELLSNGDQLLCFDTSVELPGPVTVDRSDVVRYTGAAYSTEFDASANGVGDGALCDAITVGASGKLVLSFDTAVALPGGVFADDEDLVRVDGPSAYTLIFDGSALGVPGAADVDGAHMRANGHIAISLDVSAAVGGVAADDEDVLLYDPSGPTWSLVYDGSLEDADWAAADVDAIAVPEPGFRPLLVSGLAGLLLIGRARRRRCSPGSGSGPRFAGRRSTSSRNAPAPAIGIAGTSEDRP